MVSTRGAGLRKQPLLIFMPPFRTYIYIDGFNLYYRALRNTPFKWLDLQSLFSNILGQQNNVLHIKYFTALVSGRLDPNQPIRQKTYLRAIQKYIPNLTIYYGHFLSHEVDAPISHTDPLQFARVIKTEEKGSDVNLAVHLLNDAWMDLYDCAIIVSNDSDLAEALKIVKIQLKKMVGIISPVKNPSRELMQYANFIKVIRKGVLAVSQLPNQIPGTNIYKPPTW